MAFLVSPGIDVNEVDQTNTAPATSTSVGAYAGHFNWGPAGDIITVGSEKELAVYFGSPANNINTRSFLTAASFLKYSNTLRVSRAISNAALNAANSNQVLIKNKDHFDTLTSLDFIFAARYPGTIGNSITVCYAHVNGSDLSAYNGWAYKGLFDSAPNRSLTAQTNGISTNDEIHVAVIDTLGLITGVKGSVLEKYEGLSLGLNAKNEDGGSIYYKDVINENSSYVYVNTLTETFTAADVPITENSSFAVLNGSSSTASSLVMPFVLSTSTSVSYSGGTPVTTVTNSLQAVSVKSGYIGAVGNNAKMNIRLIDSSNAPAKAATGFIRFGTPVNGDIVIVNGVSFTKAASAGAAAFVTIADLATRIDASTDLVATVVGGVINIVAAAPGAAGNAFTLALGVGNTGTLVVSSPTLRGGVTAADLKYCAATIDILSSVTGYVTYDVTVAADTLVAGPITTNITNVTLADIITEIKYKASIANDVSLKDLVFEINGAVVTQSTSISSMKLDIQALLPYNVNTQAVLNIIPFTGGEIESFNTNTLLASISLRGGTDGETLATNVVEALSLFADKDLVDINFLWSEAFNDNNTQRAVDAEVYSIANTRRDILATISAPIGIAQLSSNALKKAAVINKFDQGDYSSSSFIAFDETPVYTYNKYADTYIWIPAAGHIAGLCANADFVADPWFSPGGFNRGQLRGVTKIAYNPGQTDRDDLYKKRINSIVAIPGEGVVLLGDKTALSKPSAFDRINVRRLFNVIQRTISGAAKYQLFELNDEFTRASFKNTIDPFLRDVQGRRGIIEYRVICDETNNTPEVIDRNEFVGDIFVKPARSINFIKLAFIATRTGVDFKEIVGS